MRSSLPNPLPLFFLLFAAYASGISASINPPKLTVRESIAAVDLPIVGTQYIKTEVARTLWVGNPSNSTLEVCLSFDKSIEGILLLDRSCKTLSPNGSTKFELRFKVERPGVIEGRIYANFVEKEPKEGVSASISFVVPTRVTIEARKATFEESLAVSLRTFSPWVLVVVAVSLVALILKRKIKG